MIIPTLKTGLRRLASAAVLLCASPLASAVCDFQPVIDRYGMTWHLDEVGRKVRTLVLVSKSAHCLNDILFRQRANQLPVEIPSVFGNHSDLASLAEFYSVPFEEHSIKSDADKREFEAMLRTFINAHDIELIVLARYMQILSEEFCKEFEGRIINIHHSFLPGFKGANPYAQAHARGVKLIGATAHYVTADLDEGPIIEQDVARVTHAQSGDDYVSIGRDVEAQVLARAIHAHIHRRTFISGNRTIVFPASPGGFASERMG